MEEKDKKNNDSIVGSLNSKGIEGFIKDNTSLFVFKKTEKISAALYLLASLLQDNDQLKTDMRKVCLKMIEHSSSFIGRSVSDNGEIFCELGRLLQTASSYVYMGYVSGSFTEMNSSVLQREINLILETISPSKENSKSKQYPSFETGFFDINTSLREENEGENKKTFYSDNRNFGKKTIKRQSILNSSSYMPKESSGNRVVDQYKNNSDNKAHSKVEEKKKGRRDIIIEIASKGGGKNIKDFSSGIENCSEKTIQRELLALVEEGVLKKEGERRWSTYSLV
ncbi:MAG: hypothetical protein COV70_00795 [Parcubacteria group bacterium CG11_big_fil_rev_8_21_14_0_20_39_22]|nr:MAG: hypothetical protein COV70_00795 [Parcubacteria group bacterium CG11_big_fil_rev_8_21_14_0_20_39_22]